MNIKTAREYLIALRGNAYVFEEQPGLYPETTELAEGLLVALDLVQEINPEADVQLGWEDH